MEATSPRPGLLLATLCLLASLGGPAAFLITTPYSLCVCPEGQNVTLTCRISGPLANHHDLLYKTWYFSSNGDQRCSEKKHIRNVTEKELHHDLGRHHELLGNGTPKSPLRGQASSHHGVEFVHDHHGAFHIVVMNLTLQDSGNYCCYAVEARWEHGKPKPQRAAYGFVELQILQGRASKLHVSYRRQQRYHGRRAGNGCLHRGHPLPAPHPPPDLQAETSGQQQTCPRARQDGEQRPGHRKPRLRGGPLGERGATAPTPALLHGQPTALRVRPASALRTRHPPVPLRPRGLLLPHAGSCSRLAQFLESLKTPEEATSPSWERPGSCRAALAQPRPPGRGQHGQGQQSLNK